MTEENPNPPEPTAAPAAPQPTPPASRDSSLLDLEGGNKSERPEYVSVEAWDEEKKAIKPEAVMTELERASKIARDLRAKLSKGAQNAPAKAEDYKIPELTDEADKGAAQLLKSDAPFLKRLAAVAHKNGFSQEQYGNFLVDAAREIAKAELSAESEAPLTEEELSALKAQEYEKIGPNAPRLAATVSEYVRGLMAQGQFNDDELEVIKAATSSAAGLTMFNKLRILSGGESIPLGNHLTTDGLLSDGEIFGMMSLPEFNNSSDPKHSEIHAKVDKQLTLRVKAGRPERLQVQV